MNEQQLLNMSLRCRKRAEQCRNGLSHDIRADIFEALADDFENEANAIRYPLINQGCHRR